MGRPNAPASAMKRKAEEALETPPKSKKSSTAAAKRVTSSTSQEVGGILGREATKSTSENDLPGVTSGASSIGGGLGGRTSLEQIPKVEPLRNSFIVTDPNKPRPRGLGRPDFKETPAYTKLMEVATEVKNVARIMTNKLNAANEASKTNTPWGSPQETMVDACEKLKKFIQIYSPQVKFLSVEEHTALIKAAVQCLGNADTAELPEDDFQKVLCTFLNGMELSEAQATAVGLYPVLELYKVEEETGELDPDVKELIASINASLVKKSKGAEARLVSPGYVPEDYLTKMQKRVLSMGNVSKPIYDDWEKFLKASSLPSPIQRAQRPTPFDQVRAFIQPRPPVLKPTPKKSGWAENHMISKIISRHRTSRRLEAKNRKVHTITPKHTTYEVQPDGEPTVLALTESS